MTIHKSKLADLDMGYAIAGFNLHGKTHVLAAPEGKGPFLLFSPPDWKPTVLSDGPGGVMSIVEVPGHESTFAAIAGCYPVYRFEEGGLYVVRPGAPEEQPEAKPAKPNHGMRGSGKDKNGAAARAYWTVKKGLDIPFGHRLETLAIGGQSYIVAATIAAEKSGKDDWSRPGTVYAIRVPDDLDGTWEATPIIEGITRNHGLHRAAMDNRDILFVSGTQGLIALTVPSKEGAAWERQTILPREVSEVYAADLDEDGQNELVTIEPFHGNQLSVYKRSGDRIDGSWHRLFEADLSFGHGLWAGTLAGEPAVMAGSRSGDMDLSLFSIQSLVPFVAQRSVLEHAAGPTPLFVVNEESQDLVFSVNQAMSEVALYRISR